ncbi:GAF domain-like protein [Dipodascopsis uninucleata]
MSSQTFWPTNLANCASLLWHAFKALEMRVNWCGFYVADPNEPFDRLLLGPFMGKVACQDIRIGRGVCGTAMKDKKIKVVLDVNKWEGHIACDGETLSEVVVPLIDDDGVVQGVLDIDSLRLNGFTSEDVSFLESIAALIMKYCRWRF